MICLKERLTLRNAELSESLSATQHSRSVLEREVLSLKRTLLEVQDRNSQLEDSLAQVSVCVYVCVCVCVCVWVVVGGTQVL